MKLFLLEDNEGDIELIKEALSVHKLKYDIKIALDAEEAIFILSKIEKKLYTPNLIILDLNVPKGGGLKILRLIKTNDNLKMLPVIIFSSSSRIEDVTESYNLFANCYIIKPFELDELIKTVGIIHEFWFQTVKLMEN